MTSEFKPLTRGEVSCNCNGDHYGVCDDHCCSFSVNEVRSAVEGLREDLCLCEKRKEILGGDCGFCRFIDIWFPVYVEEEPR